MRLKERVIICANQVTLCVAASLANADKNNLKTIIFYAPTRCDIHAFNNADLYTVKLSRLNLVLYLIKNCFTRPVELCVPHFKYTILLKIYSLLVKRVSLVDDGLDTFRHSPRNIIVSDFKPNSNYYTFQYDIHLATWLNKFNLVKVCAPTDLAKSSKKIIDLNCYDTVIIESPGIETLELSKLEPQKTLLVKHSNPSKNRNNFDMIKSVSGASFALEKSITNFKGTLIVGESMVAVYALMLKSPTVTLKVFLNNSSEENLSTLLELINKSN